MGIGPKTKCLHFATTGYDLRFAKMGVKKKIEELSIKGLVEMGDVCTNVEFDLDDFFIVATGNFILIFQDSMINYLHVVNVCSSVGAIVEIYHLIFQQ